MSLHDHIKFDDKGGRPRAFNSPKEMWDKAVCYFNWCKDNAIDETKLFSFQGEVVSGSAPHMRAMTQAGLCSFLNIGQSTYKDYKNKPEFSAVTEAIEQVMFEQKFSGAAAGMLKENIIARELGMLDKEEVIHADSAITINFVDAVKPSED